MLIGYDGKRAIQNLTGLGNYSRLLLEVLSEHYPGNDYRLYAPRLRENMRMRTLMERANVSVATPQTSVGRALPALWRSRGVTAQLRADGVRLYHGLSGELPVNIDTLPAPSVVTIHDVIFRRFPQCYKPVDRWIYDRKFNFSAHLATRIIAISERTKADVVELYGISPEKIDVVYQGCDPQFLRDVPAEEVTAARRKYHLPDNPYIVTVGTVETRKNQQLALSGLRGLPADFHLVVVGKPTPYADLLRKQAAADGLGSRVHFLENVAFADLPALYAGAFASSYTSRYEGFGIPVIESLGVGTPAVVATGSCLEEAGGPDTPAVNPDDPEGWVAAVRDMIDHPGTRTRIAANGREHIKRFNNSAMARNTMEVYRRAIGQFKSHK